MLLARLSRFIFIIGLVLLVLFFASEGVGQPQYELFFTGFLGFILGLAGMIRYREPEEKVESGRFKLVKRIFGRRNKPKQDEKNK